MGDMTIQEARAKLVEAVAGKYTAEDIKVKDKVIFKATKSNPGSYLWTTNVGSLNHAFNKAGCSDEDVVLALMKAKLVEPTGVKTAFKNTAQGIGECAIGGGAVGLLGGPATGAAGFKLGAVGGGIVHGLHQASNYVSGNYTSSVKALDEIKQQVRQSGLLGAALPPIEGGSDNNMWKEGKELFKGLD